MENLGSDAYPRRCGTTLITEPMARFDQRQEVFARAHAGEFGEEFRKRFIEGKFRDPFIDASSLCWIPRGAPQDVLLQALRAAFDGAVASRVLPVEDPARMSLMVKELARFCGADLVGICEMESAFVYSALRAAPGEGEVEIVADKHRCAVVVAVEMDYRAICSGPSRSCDMAVNEGYLQCASVAIQLAGLIRDLGYPARAHFKQREEVLQVPLAVKAGLGELSRMGLLITARYGPRVRLAAVTTDLPLAPDEPLDLGVQSFCEICLKCAQCCPSQSIPAGPKAISNGSNRWIMEPVSCLKFWRSRPERFSSCSRCVAVCPWNQRDRWYHSLAVATARTSSLVHRPLLWLDDLLRGRRPSPSPFSYPFLKE